MGEGEADREREGGGSHVIILAAEGVAGWRERESGRRDFVRCVRAHALVSAQSPALFFESSH